MLLISFILFIRTLVDTVYMLKDQLQELKMVSTYWLSLNSKYQSFRSTEVLHIYFLGSLFIEKELK